MRRPLLLLLLLLSCSASSNRQHDSPTSNSTERAGIEVVSWRWHEVRVYIIVVLFLIVACILKTAYHHIHVLTVYVPESNVLILLGVAIGLIVFLTAQEAKVREDSMWSLSPELFFFILLPPIMLEAAYSLYDRAFIDNLGSILLFAVGGTVTNFALIGLCLYGLWLCGAMGEGLHLSLGLCLLFGSFIVAVDPVAVLAIFHDIGVEHSLYYLVFGESLLNDAVTVVLYSTMTAFLNIPEVHFSHILLGFVSFFTISLGGLAVGVACGVVSSLLTRYTYSSRVVEPLILLTLAYGSYVFADLFGWSGLISIIGCGIVQAAYAFHNVSRKSLITIKYFTKMAASAGEAIVFLYLGVELVKEGHIWHWGFAPWALCLCLIVRFAVTFGMSAALNLPKARAPIKLTEQFIIAFGGLRGAVAFALVNLVEESAIAEAGFDPKVKELFMTTTLFIIMFTCLVIGVAMKPTVKCLRIRRSAPQVDSVLYEVTSHAVDHLTAGIEEIAGHRGGNYLRETFARLDDAYIRPLLQRDPSTQDQQIVDTYFKVDLKMHLAKSERSLSRQTLADPYVDANVKRRIGEKEVNISKDPSTLLPADVRKVMKMVRRKSCRAHSSLTKALHSDTDTAQRLTDVQRRMASGFGILRTSSNRRAQPGTRQQQQQQQQQQESEANASLVRFHIEDPGGETV